MSEQSISELFDALPTIIVIGDLTEEQKMSKLNKPYLKRRQRALYSYIVDGYTIQFPCEIPIDKNQQPYPHGMYKLSGGQFRLNAFGDLESDGFAMHLVPVSEQIDRFLEQDRQRRAKAAA